MRSSRAICNGQKITISPRSGIIWKSVKFEVLSLDLSAETIGSSGSLYEPSVSKFITEYNPTPGALSLWMSNVANGPFKVSQFSSPSTLRMFSRERLFLFLYLFLSGLNSKYSLRNVSIIATGAIDQF